MQEEEDTSLEPDTSQQDPGSDSDSDCGEGPYPFAPQQPPAHLVNSLEASMMSLDMASSASSMEVSGYTDVEVMYEPVCK